MEGCLLPVGSEQTAWDHCKACAPSPSKADQPILAAPPPVWVPCLSCSGHCSSHLHYHGCLPCPSSPNDFRAELLREGQTGKESKGRESKRRKKTKRCLINRITVVHASMTFQGECTHVDTNQMRQNVTSPLDLPLTCLQLLPFSR